MALTTEQYRTLLDAITVAPTEAALADLRGAWRKELGGDVEAGFVELLIDVRLAKLSRVPSDRGRVANAR